VADKKIDGTAFNTGQGQPLASFEQLIPARIHKVSDTLEDVARLMLGEAYGLGFTETRILAYLGENRSASVVDISRDLRVDKAWISRRLQSLASKKLIAKKPDSFDSRAILVSLTAKGRLAAERAMGVVRQTYGTIMNGVDEKLANELITTLETNLHAILSQLRSGQKSVVGPICDAPV
jgi:DNA-binding MarR family transcriptional regulator